MWKNMFTWKENTLMLKWVSFPFSSQWKTSFDVKKLLPFLKNDIKKHINPMQIKPFDK